MAISLAPFVLRRPWLSKMLKPVATWYVNASGYRQLGLRYDDLIEEESHAAQTALKRLSPKESYERIYRIRRANQCGIQRKVLPREEWTKPEEDLPQLRHILDEVKAELAERDALDNIEIDKGMDKKKVS